MFIFSFTTLPCSWTDVDTNITCRKLGFNGGTFEFVSFAQNDSSYMLYYKPECLGDENDIMDCPGSRGIKIGSRICGKLGISSGDKCHPQLGFVFAHPLA